jgi:energy-coupling factor transport system ATP-binding protein
VIEFKNVSFTYHSDEIKSGIKNVNLKIPTGQVVLFCGKSGCGKTTLTRLINGLIPEYYEGSLHGEVLIDNIIASKSPLYEVSKKVGSVFQNPRSQFFNVDSTSEIAFGCENMGLPVDTIYDRIGKVVSELKINELMDRNLFELSGGEKQKIACASVSAMEPEVFVLDEPSSNLDMAAIRDLKQAIEDWKKKGKTIIIAEHRLYYLMELADRVIYMKNGEIIRDMTIDKFKQIDDNNINNMGLRSLHPTISTTSMSPLSDQEIQLTNFYFSYEKKEAVNIPSLAFPKGSIIGVLGNNGAGKTTFARCLCGLTKKSKGTMIYNGKKYEAKERIRICYMVMQDVNHQLFTESVLDEIILSMEGKDETANTDAAIEILKSLELLELKDLHPMSLSGGQKQRVAIGSAIASSKEILLFDEPTSGLDYTHMVEVANLIKELSDMDKTILIVSHDPELINRVCNYFIFIKDGTVQWSGKPIDNKNRLLHHF